MKSIKIIALNEKGKEAIQSHYKESLKIKAMKPMMKVLGISQHIISENPYTLELTFGKRLGSILKPNHMLIEIQANLKENNVEEGIDYKIEIE